jgi:sterol desaturase/sphingolipid hydroxylase (fatty acid hydroxylase superfamily)
VYFIFSIILALIIHDTYFYWAHRLMHHPKLFKIFHLVHHKSTNPTPWAAYAFHPLEAIVEGGVIWLIVFIIPIHPIAITTFTLLMIIFNIYGHLGFEIYPKWAINSPIGKWLNPSTNHNMHHKYVKDNYGLYFRFWDEIMKTTNPKYDETVEELLGEKAP